MTAFINKGEKVALCLFYAGNSNFMVLPPVFRLCLVSEGKILCHCSTFVCLW